MTTNFTRVWGGLKLEMRTEYGRAARKNRGSFTGVKTHRLHCEYVVGIEDGKLPMPGTFGAMFIKKGKPILFSCMPACGCTQGQHAASVVPGKTEADVNCEKCKR